MDIVTELFSLQQEAMYSYDFIYLSLQEFLVAYTPCLSDGETHTGDTAIENMYREPLKIQL